LNQIKDLQQLMQMGQQMQARMSEMRERLESETTTARSGGGMIEATVDGTGTLQGIWIERDVVDPDDVEMLEDLILAAISEAQRRAREKMEEQMQEATGGLQMPGLGNLSSLLGG